jgi:ectoine hydroxylase
MGIRSRLKRLKPAHWMYNLLNYKALLHNRRAYRQFNLQKPVFASLSSKDFPDKTSKAWLDTGDSSQLVQQKEGFDTFSSTIQQQLVDWSKNGFMVLENFFDSTTVNIINKEIDTLVAGKKVTVTHDNKIAFANKLVPAIKDVTQTPELVALLSFILGKEVIPFQTLNFLHGSGQRAHSDSIHMTTYPLGYLIAAWVALEDIEESSGPLFYYPGSHQLPYLLNEGFGNVSTMFSLGKKNYADYEDVTQDIIAKNDLQPIVFLPKKGDVFIWHANLIHGGMPVRNTTLTRKSMVIHYYAKDVIKYHEITERPSLI